MGFTLYSILKWHMKGTINCKHPQWGCILHSCHVMHSSQQCTEEERKKRREKKKGDCRHKMHHFPFKPHAQDIPRLSQRKPLGARRRRALTVHGDTCIRHGLRFAYLWWLHSQHQTESGWVDHSSKCTPSPVPHRWRVHVAIHSIPCRCNSWWRWGKLVSVVWDCVEGMMMTGAIPRREKKKCQVQTGKHQPKKINK